MRARLCMSFGPDGSSQQEAQGTPAAAAPGPLVSTPLLKVPAAPARPSLGRGFLCVRFSGPWVQPSRNGPCTLSCMRFGIPQGALPEASAVFELPYSGSRYCAPHTVWTRRISVLSRDTHSAGVLTYSGSHQEQSQDSDPSFDALPAPQERAGRGAPGVSSQQVLMDVKAQPFCTTDGGSFPIGPAGAPALSAICTGRGPGGGNHTRGRGREREVTAPDGRRGEGREAGGREGGGRAVTHTDEHEKERGSSPLTQPHNRHTGPHFPVPVGTPV